MIINVQLKANINCSMTTAKVYSGKNSTTTTTDRPWFIFTLYFPGSLSKYLTHCMPQIFGTISPITIEKKRIHN